MVSVEEQTSIQQDLSNPSGETSKKMSAKEKRRAERAKKMKCHSWRLVRLAQPKYRVEKFTPQPYPNSRAKTPKPLGSDVEEKMEELAKPKGRILRENQFLFHNVFNSKSRATSRQK